MQKFIIFLLVAAIVFCGPITASAAQSGGSVNVYLPSFKVIINGVETDNTYSQYPFIVYQDITYFPMTYGGCRFLGIETEWQNETTGLSIGKTGITAAYCPYTKQVKNAVNNKAYIVTFPVTVTGKAIDNSCEPYPLLLFHDVTYFPMTWRFCVDEFGWDYSYDVTNGLTINSDNIKLKEIQMPAHKTEYDRDVSEPILNSLNQNVTVTDKYIYYQEMNGQIMRADITDVSKKRAVYQLPINTVGSSYVLSGLYTKKDAVYLSYHIGGGFMGSDQTFMLNDDGTSEKRGSHSHDFGDISIGIPDYTGAPGAGNLSIKTGAGDWKQLGNPNYLYGWKWIVDKNSAGGSVVDTAYLDNNDLYILGFDMTCKDKNLTTGIYKVNIKTNKTTRISEKEVWDFRADGGFLYYQSGGTFYKYSLKDAKETPIKTVTNMVEKFEVLNGNVYWQDQCDSGLYDLDSGKNMNQGAELDTMGLSGENNQYLVCTFQETSNAKYRIMVFDRDGNIVFKTSDKAFCRNISIKGKTIYFYNCTTDTVCVGSF